MKKHHKISLSLLAVMLVAAGVFQLYSVRPTQQIAAASNTAQFTVAPSNGGFTVGSTVSFSIYVSLDNNYNVASADFYYNKDKFQYLSATYSASFPNGRGASQGSNGYGSYIAVTGSRSSGTLKGRQLLATLQFKMRTAGSAYGNFGKTTAILYPTKNYATTAQNGIYAVNNPAPTTPPPTTPTSPATTPSTPSPSPTPAPSTASPTTPSSTAGTTTKTQRISTRAATTSVVPTTSQPSSSGLVINDFVVSEKDYRTALLTWKTTIPSTTKVNYGTDKEDLYLEQKDDAKVTDHKIQLDTKNLKAGSRYYLRITSDDGKGPVTIDGDFYTKFIPVIVKVTDETEQPITDVEVSSGEAGGFTNENGETLLELPEGDVVIYAQKDDLQRELAATIELPSGEDSSLQRITMSLTPGSAPVAQNQNDSKKSPVAAIVAGIVGVLLLGFGGFVLFMRRKNAKRYSGNDPLEADNHTQHTIPTTPPPTNPQPTTLKRTAPQPIATAEPSYTPVQNPALEHHASLPELVGRYGTQSTTAAAAHAPAIPEPQTSTPQTPQQNVPPQQSPHPETQHTNSTQQQAPAPHPPTPQLLQQPPRHTSLKELVHVDAKNNNLTDTDATPFNDLPYAPTATSESTTPSNESTPKPDASSEGSLTIPH